MNYFVKPDGSIHAFESDYEGPLITADMLPISREDVAVRQAVPFSASKEAELDKFRAERLAMFNVIAGMGFAAIATGDTVTAAALVAFREGVKDLTQFPAVVAATDLATLKAAMSARYKALVAELPAAIKSDFKALAS
jgi:NADPH-dependent glutamate synthase beta subunit-like oxidoreductase